MAHKKRLSHSKEKGPCVRLEGPFEVLLRSFFGTVASSWEARWLIECLLCFQRLEEEHQAHSELRVQYQKMSFDFADMKTRLKTDDYKVENYDKVK